MSTKPSSLERQRALYVLMRSDPSDTARGQRLRGLMMRHAENRIPGIVWTDGTGVRRTVDFDYVLAWDDLPSEQREAWAKVGEVVFEQGVRKFGA